MRRLVVLVVCASALFVAACHREPKPMTPKEGELPPLPPASGTAVGYLVDNAAQLELRDDQLERLKQLDTSLAARNDSIDTQLRAIERPDEVPTAKGEEPERFDYAPGAQVRTTRDAAKLHEAKAANNRDAIEKAFAVLDDKQRDIARRLLEERGVATPDAAAGAGAGAAKRPTPATP